MKIKPVLSKVFWGATDLLLVLFVLPFGFVMSYYFYLFFTGKNRPGLLGDLAAFSATISWVSCAFLFLIALVLRAMIKNHKQWHSLFFISFIGGGVWLILLNLFVETTFTLWRSLFPLTLCSLISTVYALGKALYRDDSWNFSDEPQLDYRESRDEQGSTDIPVCE